MKRGDRIVTPSGRRGRILGERRERSWGMGRRPIVRVWLLVELDDGEGRVLVSPADAKLEADAA